MDKKIIKQISLSLNLFVFVSGLVAILLQIFNKDENINGIEIFKFFTNDSNIFAIIVSLITSIYLIYSLKNNKDSDSKVIYILNLMSAVSLIIVFFVVVFVLIPSNVIGVKGYSLLMEHGLIPLIVVLNFLFCYSNKISKKLSIIGIIPLMVYAVFSLTFCITKVWIDSQIPYPFLNVYNNPIWMSILYTIGIVGGSTLISIGISRLSYKLYLGNLIGKGLKRSIIVVSIVIILVLIYLIIFQFV